MTYLVSVISRSASLAENQHDASHKIASRQNRFPPILSTKSGPSCQIYNPLRGPIANLANMHAWAKISPPCRDQPIMLIFLPIMLCSSAQNFHLLCSILCSCERLVLFIRIYLLVSLSFLRSQLFYLKFNTLAVVQIVAILWPNGPYYAGIMLDAFSYLLCSKLCWHNRLVPTPMCMIVLAWQLHVHER